MRQIFDRHLWVGHSGDLRDMRGVLAAEIEAVIELSDSDPSADLPRELVRCRFPLSDGGDNAPWRLRLACESVAALMRARVPVLVCCSAGMSRSVCIAAGAIVLTESLLPSKALAIVTESGPADVSPGLWVQLQDALQPSVSSLQNGKPTCDHTR
jgi:hypothetical protein